LTGHGSWHADTPVASHGGASALGTPTGTSTPPGANATDLATLKAAIAGKRPAIALTKNMSLSPYGLVSDHAYTVLAVNGTTVTLRNPWGTDGPKVQGANDGVITVRVQLGHAGVLRRLIRPLSSVIHPLFPAFCYAVQRTKDK
jgi:hypothetical protein